MKNKLLNNHNIGMPEKLCRNDIRIPGAASHSEHKHKSHHSPIHNRNVAQHSVLYSSYAADKYRT